jgi:hypothetical protein
MKWWWWGYQLIDLGDLISGAYCKKCITDNSATFSEVWVPQVMRGAYSNMRHWYLNYQWCMLVYAPCITLAEVRPIGPMWGPHVINGAFFMMCTTKRSNMRGAYSNCAIDNTGYFVDDPSGGSHMDISGAFCTICAISRKIISGAYLQMRH